MKREYLRYVIGFIIICAFAFLVSCGSRDDDGNGGGVNGGDVVDLEIIPSAISLATSRVTVSSDNSDSATITATVLDEDNVVAQDVPVTFSTDGGQVSDATVQTDEDGQAVTEFSSGTVDKSNRVATITARAQGLDPTQIPIQIAGTTISLSTDTTNIEVGESPAVLTIVVKDAGDIPIYNAQVDLSVTPRGVVTLSQDTGYTNVTGELEVEVTGTGSGDVTIAVESLGSIAAQEYSVGTVGAVFGIIEPSIDPYRLETNTNLTVVVNVSDANQDSVIFATTIGTWDGGAESVVEKAVSGGTAQAVLLSSDAGTATIQVSDPDNPSVTDTLTVAISAPSDEAAQVAIQAGAGVVAPSTGDIENSINLTATVRNAADQVVGGSPVAFSIENPTGGGEYIFPVIVYTNDSGVANSTFTSGSLSTDAGGVTVKAEIVGGIDSDTISVVIGGAAGSVVIGRSTKVESNETDTAYILPMSVLVSDSNGNPVSGATVSLSIWPALYHTGYWVEVAKDECIPWITGTYENEDINKNIIMDPGEDSNGDGQLTPPSSAAGSVVATVVTDDSGVGNFDLTYLKASAVWISAELKANTLVLGTETESRLLFFLPYSLPDQCFLPHSPYGE